MINCVRKLPHDQLGRTTPPAAPRASRTRVTTRGPSNATAAAVRRHDPAPIVLCQRDQHEVDVLRSKELPSMDICDPQFSVATIPPTILARLRDIAVERGFDPEPWFVGTGVLPGQLDAPESLVSFRQATTILRRALRALPDGPLGVEVGARNAIVGFGVLGFAMRSCRTGAEAFGLGIEMHRLCGSMLDYELVQGDPLSTLRVYERIPDPELSRFLIEETFTNALLFSRSVLNEEIIPVHASVCYPKPAYAEQYRRYFGCPIEFNCGVTEASFATELLARPIRTHNEANLAAALDAVKRMAAATSSQHDTVASVEAILGENLRRSITMAEVADRLFVTERTLRRRLNAADERFSDIHDRVRQRRALFLVHETTMTITQIAAETGYSDAREFRRAYIRWNGEPPSDTRRLRELARVDAAPVGG
ncbi:AraC family transcriptional regulator [Nocardia terpenica]|uniref:AraC family transcriptional regulator n=1 Tax=Nocardia terpenica TaxID=455432 RepID=A0A291RNH3_9NOCA|nr:AraC family transcriptional regulator [Nocardia terpenica]